MMGIKKRFILVGLILVVLLVMLYAGYSLFNSQQKMQPSQQVSFSITPPANLETIPTIKDEGVNRKAGAVQTSEKEIQKLYQYLPFTKDYTLSTDVPVSIVIPGQDLQTAPWALQVNISGIDFRTSPSSGDYELMKSSFREAARDIFIWMDEKGVDHTKTYMLWGEREYMQKRAEEWLAN